MDDPYYTVLLWFIMRSTGDTIHMSHCGTYPVMCCVQISWAFGGVLEATLALVVMTNIDGDNAWRWLLCFSTLPVLTVMLLYPVSVACIVKVYTVYC